MEIIVLAGGFGTRLKSVVSDLPKPMAPVRDKPFVEYLLNWIKNYQVSRIIFSVGYKHEIIVEYFGNEFNSIPVSYAIEDRPLGTGGAIVNSFQFMETDTAIIINGDTWFPINLDELNNIHLKNDNKLTIALKELKDFDRYGTVNLEDGIITEFIEKKYCETGFINAGVYAVNKNFIKDLNLPEVFSFEKDVFEKQAKKGVIKGCSFNAQFLDIGIPEDYNKAELML